MTSNDPGPGDPDEVGVPAELRALHARLSKVRFEPRHALGAEIEGRLRRGEVAPARAPDRARWAGIAAVLAAGALAAGLLLWVSSGGAGPTAVDRCCFDLDGGGSRDDGVLVSEAADGSLRELAIYEDRDGSATFTPADTIRFRRGPGNLVSPELARGSAALHHCCDDFDGGGAPDDGLLVVGAPPDRVLMAAIYETGPDDRTRRRFQLR